jgi:hypothetical protein
MNNGENGYIDCIVVVETWHAVSLHAQGMAVFAYQSPIPNS